MADVHALVKEISDLPTLPDVVARLNRMIADPSTSASDINDVISRDVSLSAKILKLVNSPYYGFSRRITTITYAVVILGFSTVRNLALSAFIFDAFKKKGDALFDIEGFWRLSIGTAIASAAVAKASNSGADEDAFMAGLLHGVGKVVMNQYIAEDMQSVMERVQSDDCRFIDAEHQVLDYDHCQLGGLLLERWNLPESIVETVKCHLAPEHAAGNNNLTAVVHLGLVLARSLSIGAAGDERIPVLDEGAWRQLGLTWQQVDTLLGAIRTEVSHADDFFALT